MTRRGTFNPNAYSDTMPLDAPAVHTPPHQYRGMELIIMEYTSDADCLAACLPEGMELTDTPTASMVIGLYHHSTFGPYYEYISGIHAAFDGTVYHYIPYIFTSHEAPLIAGREVWGYPKKLATMGLETQSELYMGWLERPRGNRLATAVMRTVEELDKDEFQMLPLASLRVIPNASGSGEPDLAQLISCEFDVRPMVGTDGHTEVWKGPGSLNFPNECVTDPVHRLPVKEMQACMYGFFNAYLPYGRVLKNY